MKLKLKFTPLYDYPKNIFGQKTMPWLLSHLCMGEEGSEDRIFYKNASSDIIPVEVKSGQRTQAKSLKSYMQQHHPVKTVKLVGAAGGTQNQTELVWPVYYAAMLDVL